MAAAEAAEAATVIIPPTKKKKRAPVARGRGRFAPWVPTILSALLCLTIVYIIVYQLVHQYFSATEFFRPASKYCHNSEEQQQPCSRPDLFAFQVVGAIMQCFMGFTGLYAWYVGMAASTTSSKPSTVTATATPQGRLFGYVPAADRLNAGIFVFQTWDFFVSMTIPEHCTALFLLHHAVTAVTAYCSLEYQIVHYYAIFFGGCSEISSIFLVVCDFNEYFPTTTTSNHDDDGGSSSATAAAAVWAGTVLFCQAMFVVTFFYYRVVGWIQVSYHLWSDALQVLRQQRQQHAADHHHIVEEKYSNPQTTFLYLFLTVDVLLGLLQLYWFLFGIVPKIMEILSSN